MQMNVHVYMLSSINIQNLAESKENILKDSESIFAIFNFFDQCFIENILILYKRIHNIIALSLWSRFYCQCLAFCVKVIMKQVKVIIQGRDLNL